MERGRKKWRKRGREREREEALALGKAPAAGRHLVFVNHFGDPTVWHVWPYIYVNTCNTCKHAASASASSSSAYLRTCEAHVLKEAAGDLGKPSPADRRGGPPPPPRPRVRHSIAEADRRVGVGICTFVVKQ